MAFSNSHLAHYRFLVQPFGVFGLLTLFSVGLFLVMLPVPRVDGQLVGSDGTFYYVYARSWLFDRDLDFHNEYAYFFPNVSWEKTPTGYLPNKHAIGPALLWMPFFLMAHLAAQAASALGVETRPDGYSHIYQAFVLTGSIVYGALGFWLAYVCSRRMFSQAATLMAVALLWLASNAFYYMVFEPSMAHMVSLFSVALLYSIWFFHFRQDEAPALHWGGLIGLAGGLVLLVRLQDAILLLLPYGSILLRWIRAVFAGRAPEMRQWLKLGLITLIVTVLVFSPQLLTWQILYGTWTSSPYMQDHDPAFYWFAPQIIPVLFSTFHGLFSWHPVYLLAAVGLGLLFRRDRLLAAGLLLMLALNVYVVASWWAWWQGDSFGGRMFLNATWIWVLGLAALIEKARSHRVVTAVLVLGTWLVAWNALSLVQYRLGFVPMDQPLTWQQMTLERLLLPWLLLERS